MNQWERKHQEYQLPSNFEEVKKNVVEQSVSNRSLSIEKTDILR